MIRYRLAVSLFAVAAVAQGCVAHAQSYPAKAVTLVVPFSAGSATDVVARALGQELSKSLGQPFVVDNKPGASGILGAQAVAASRPDGYTLLVTTNTTQAANVSLFKRLPYDPQKDFAPVGLIATTPFMLVVNLQVPVHSVRQLVSLAKARPGQLSYGQGSSASQVAGALFKEIASIDVLEVPYKSIPPALTDLIGNQISFMFADIGNAMAQVRAGKLRALGVTSERRATFASDYPSLAEEGVAGYEVVAWFGLVAPAKTPKPVIATVAAALQRALATRELREFLAANGMDAAFMPPEQFSTFVGSETEKWAGYVRRAGIQPQ
jgi:tripartite-type tricarboxylate transporter receptor subunit TctC